VFAKIEGLAKSFRSNVSKLGEENVFQMKNRRNAAQALMSTPFNKALAIFRMSLC